MLLVLGIIINKYVCWVLGFFYFFYLSFVWSVFKLGNDSLIKFWHETWCRRLPLRVHFPKLFHIASHKDASMADILSFEGVLP